MKKLATVFFVLLSFTLSAQTIFYYGNDSVSVHDFLKAYNKNNTGPKNEKALREYLDLYVASRLKIKEAQQRGYDTLPQLAADLQNLRQQILPTYLNDKESMNRLMDEALVRSQKDIHLAHIFITIHPGAVGQAEASKKLADVMAALKSSSNEAAFANVAKQYSDDPSAKINGGDLGWITVFSLPYELENIAYATPVGGLSKVHQSKAGYHIFKNLGERRDPGKIRAAQILLAFPPDDQSKAHIKELADSLYTRLQMGDDFGKLATAFSNDVVSAAANGQMPEFSVGQYDPIFEHEVFALKDGGITKPFLTSHGYHIVKLLGKEPLPTRSDKKAMEILKVQVEQSDRIASIRSDLAKKILSSPLYKKSAFRNEELWSYSDSILNYKPGSMPVRLNNSTTLFKVGSKNVAVIDWIGYAQTYRYKQDGSGMKSYPELWNEFQEAMAVDYYQNHLEDFNPEFRQQITEFSEGNLFFEIMQREVWGPAQTDSAALLDYYNRNKSKYTWKASADAVIFYASDVAAAKTFSAQLKKSTASWQELVTNFSEKIAADSSRFELTQIPNPGKTALKPGTITAPLINKADNTASFAWIIRVYSQAGQRSFSEARGLVINDYQAELEKAWLAQLEKKYPVRMNRSVVDKMLRGK